VSDISSTNKLMMMMMMMMIATEESGISVSYISQTFDALLPKTKARPKALSWKIKNAGTLM